MDIQLLREEKRRVTDEFGPWTASNIHLGDELYTISERIDGDEIKLRRVVQVVADTARTPVERMRVLDLACHEGIYAIEFARRGAEVVGIEGRDMHLAKANFVKRALGLDRLTFVRDDVRNLNRKTYGWFDTVLCLGILYHLDVPDVFSLLRQIADVCREVAIIDTRIALGPTESFEFEGTRYWGHRVREGHREGDSETERMQRYWASLDNLTSFPLSRTSLYCMLSRVGFTSVYECYVPAETNKPIDRITLLAIKGRRQTIMNSPLVNEYPENTSPEEFTGYKVERAYGRFYRLTRLIPERVRVAMVSGGLLGRLFRPFPAAIGRSPRGEAHPQDE